MARPLAAPTSKTLCAAYCNTIATPDAPASLAAAQIAWHIASHKFAINCVILVPNSAECSRTTVHVRHACPLRRYTHRGERDGLRATRVRAHPRQARRRTRRPRFARARPHHPPAPLRRPRGLPRRAASAPSTSQASMSSDCYPGLSGLAAVPGLPEAAASARARVHMHALKPTEACHPGHKGDHSPGKQGQRAPPCLHSVVLGPGPESIESATATPDDTATP